MSGQDTPALSEERISPCQLRGAADAVEAKEEMQAMDWEALPRVLRGAADVLSAQAQTIATLEAERDRLRAEVDAELQIARRDAANALERAQRAEARNAILRDKDKYDLPAVLERANQLQRELDEKKWEADPRNASIVTKRVRAKAAAANKAREAAEARASSLEERVRRIIDAHDEWAEESGFTGIDDPLTDEIEAARAALAAPPSAGEG